MQQSTRLMRLAAILALTAGYAGAVRAEDPPAGEPAAAPAEAAAPAAEAATAAPAAAAEAPSGPKISGYVQSSYTYDMNNPLNNVTTYRVYDVHNSFLLNNAHVALTGSIGKVNYTIETDMGHDAFVHKSAGFGVTAHVPTLTPDPVSGGTPFTTGTQDISVDPDADIFDVQEAYATFPDPFLALVGIEATVKVGKWATYSGIELIESGSNPTITRGYLFGWAEAWTHVGAAVSVPVGPATITFGVINGWDKIMDNNDAQSGLANVFVNLGDKIGTVNLTGYSGSEDANTGLKKNHVDITGVLKVIPMIDLWWQATYNDQQVYYDPTTMTGGGVNKNGGATLQPLVKLSDKFTVGLRAEYFEEKSYAAPGNIWSNGTLCLNWMHAAGIVTRFEFRHDESKNVAGTANGGPAGRFESWEEDVAGSGLGKMKRGASSISIETIVNF